MEGIFKQKLLTLREGFTPKTFGAALLGKTEWGAKKTVLNTNPPEEKFSEKAHVLESLERFAQEKAVEQEKNIFSVEGGEVALKAEPEWDGIKTFSTLQDLRNSLRLDSSILDIVLSGKAPGKVKVLFVSEKFRPWNEVSEELRSGFINELIVGFAVKTAELFERMIGAMKLSPEEVIIYPVEGAGEEDFAEDVMQIASFFSPEVVVTLGAKATQRILKSNDRLTLVHGQFFTRKIGGKGSTQVVPLFHPSIIESNLNMKKTAWTDMQKIMKHLKKLP